MDKLSQFIIIALLIFLMSSTASNASYNRTRRRFGDCLEGHESCSECYLTLKESLLSRDDNIQNLSAAFFPWNASNPIFVTVTYNFNNLDDSEVWYWTTDSSYLFFEITTFQYLSLFFSKPAALFSQKVNLTLEEDCNYADDRMFKLLTQRLKNLIEKKSFNPEIDENYFARSEKNAEDLLTSKTSIYILVFHIAGFIIAFGITFLMLWIYFNTKRWDNTLRKMGSERSKFYKYSQSKIFSIALTAGILMLYILALDITTIVTLKDKPHTLAVRNIDDSALPYIVFSFDSLMVALWGMCWILSFVTCCSCKYCKLDGKQQYLLQAISTVGPVFTLVIHLPYIAIAYLNDAAYATSSFIYYTVVAFVIFGAFELTYGTFQQALIARDERYPNNNQQNVQNNLEAGNADGVGNQGLEEQAGEEDAGHGAPGRQNDAEVTCNGPCFPFCIKNERVLKCIWGITIPFFALIMLTLIGLTTAALVVVPISKAFSDAPNRLVGFYQTAIVVVGVYFAYKSFFKKKPTLETAIKKRMKHILSRGNDDESNTKWKRLSKDEKVAAFYDYVVELVASYDPKQTKDDEANREENDLRNDQENSGDEPRQPQVVEADVNEGEGNDEEGVGVDAVAGSGENSEIEELLPLQP